MRNTFESKHQSIYCNIIVIDYEFSEINLDLVRFIKTFEFHNKCV